MFTGLIESLGTITSQEKNRLEILVNTKNHSLILSDLAIGDSVAVDGVCLTVETILDKGFVATISPETIEKSNLQERDRTAKYVNLETSLRVGGKIGGHFVTGHIDGIGRLIESSVSATSWEMCFGQPPGKEQQWQEYIAPYLVTKGSIAINGISLTIADCGVDSSWFQVAVIPHTYQETNLSHLQPGNLVNLESDILGKYVEKLLGNRVNTHDHQSKVLRRALKDSPSGQTKKQTELPRSASTSSNINLNFLAENGYV